MEFDLENFIEDFVDTIMFDIENTRSQKTFIRYDIKETVRIKLREFKDNIIAEYKEEMEQEVLEASYDKGYNEGYEAALDEVNDSIDKIWMTRGRS